MVVEKYHRKVMNGNVMFVELNFQERVETEHLKKEGNNGKVCSCIGARYCLGAIVSVFSILFLRARIHCDFLTSNSKLLT